METIIKILNNLKPGVDFTAEKDLVNRQILTSMEIMLLTGELNDAFDIEITLPYIIPENFSSAEAIYDMVQRIEEDE
ncbi:MAG: acyl carrier protein [Lachnospiraceae bacterium]|nr:acyl carrier protein [Lachnospiraceae bacterium]MDY4969755.1 acyl carrier protein [Lachnospiraceae bacterium]